MPSWLIHIFSLVFGLITGSFVNVIVARLPQGKSIVYPPSHCPKCRKRIQWRDNVPILSYLILGGRCRSCKKPISLRYPTIEVLTAILFLAIEMRFGVNSGLFVRGWPFATLLVAITFIDLEKRIIPDPLSLGGLVLGILTCWMDPKISWVESLAGAAFGFSVFYGLAWIYYRISGRQGLGGGDIKLLAMLGAFLGPAGVFATIFISSIFGSMVGISWALFTKKTNVLKLSIPYGPFLVIGALYYYLLGDILWFQFMTPM